MKILNTKKGFTTNSSGSYEWIPPIQNNAKSTASESQTMNPGQYEFTKVNQGHDIANWIILPISIISGLIAVWLIIKELAKPKKKKQRKK